jgi:phosphoglucosamine mutase
MFPSGEINLRKRLFGSSGIRGVSNKYITTNLAQKVGMALATLSKNGLFTVGKDARNTGELLEKALVSGILSCGGAVYSAGLCPTPVIAWMTKHVNADAGVSISASHNPPEYNGFKIFNKNGMSLTEEEQKILENLIERNLFEPVKWNMINKISEKNANLSYVKNVTRKLVLRKKWRIVCDCFTGAAGVIAPRIFRSLGLEAYFLNVQPDGNFPAGNPEPNPINSRRLGKFVESVGADIGFVFDGDSDRMHVIDENGSFMKPDSLLAAFSNHVVTEKNGGTVVTHVGTSMSIEDMVARAGGRVIRTKVGDAYITETMQKEKAIFGGEPVGAWVHPRINMCPDGVLSSLKLLEALEKIDMSVSVFIKEVKEYPIARAKYNCIDENKKDIMKSIRENVKKYFDIKSFNNIDGVRIETQRGWVLFRPSGTEPYIRITGEAENNKSLNNLMETAKNLINLVMVV